MTTGGKKLFWSYMRGRYNLFEKAEEKPLSEEMKQEIKESIIKKQPSLSDKIQCAEKSNKISNLETMNPPKKSEPER